MNISPAITKQSSRTNSDVIILRLSEMIQRGEIHLLPGGQFPPERELANLLGVSLLMLRNGIRSLSAIGILRSQPGVGTFVVESNDLPSLDSTPLRLFAELHGFTFDEMFETKVLIELLIAALAAERATNEDLTLLAEEITEMFASLDEPELFLLHTKKFHQNIAAASKNRILTFLMNMVTNIFFEESCQSLNRTGDLKSSAKMHFQIYRAIRERNPEAAKNIMHNHLIENQKIRLKPDSLNRKDL